MNTIPSKDNLQGYLMTHSASVSHNSTHRALSSPPLDPIVHPCSIFYILLMGINDQILKFAYPSWLTGKLSDVAIVIFFPVLVEKIIPNRVVAIFLTGLCFVLAKVTIFGNNLYNDFFSWWYSFFGRNSAPLVMDESDCWALIALLIPLWVIPRAEVKKERGES